MSPDLDWTFGGARPLKPRSFASADEPAAVSVPCHGDGAQGAWPAGKGSALP